MYYFVAIFLSRNTLVTFIPIIFSHSISLQLLSAFMCHALYLTALLVSLPWREQIVNTLDTIVNVSLLTLVQLGGLTTSIDKEADEVSVLNPKILFTSF